MAAGRALFEANCAPCHGPQADGVIGPSLRDEAWIHGREPARIFGTIADGVPPRGMPAWRPLLGAEAVADLTAYVIALGRD